MFRFAVPPSILPFHFARSLDQGEVAQLQCIVSTGDTPLSITWAFHGKDSSTRTQTGVTITKIGSKTSLLTMESVSQENAGSYTCQVSNKAGTANYTAELVVNGEHEFLST